MAHVGIQKVCGGCGERFAATSGIARFCSDRCHLLANATRQGTCLIWCSCLDKDGYGVVKFRGGRRTKAHRASYQEFVGTIPEGKMVCHSCDMPGCIEPAHLFLGTALDNKADCVTKARHVHGESMHTNKLTEDQVRAILSDARPAPVIAAEYGVTKENVYAIRDRKIWKHLAA
jgi:hypothetical protein